MRAGFLHGDENPGDWVHFGNDDYYVALQQNREHSVRNDTRYVHDGINHLGFVVEDVNALIDKLRSAGYLLTEGSAIDEPWRKRVYFVDGNGFEWEFVEYLSETPSQKNDYSSCAK